MRFFAAIFLLLAATLGLRAQLNFESHVQAELVSANAAIAPGETFWVAVRLQMDDHWHTYWINAGDAGIPTTLKWVDPPEGFSAGDIQWPTPVVFEQAGIVNYVYEHEVLLWMQLSAPSTLQPGDTLDLKARLDWLECDDQMCVPGGADVALSLPVSDAAEPSGWAERLKEDRAVNWPQALPDAWTAAATRSGETLTLTLSPSGEAVGFDPGEVYFFSRDGQVDPNAGQTVTRAADGAITFTFTANPYLDSGEATTLPGVVRAENGWLPGGAPVGLAVAPKYGVAPAATPVEATGTTAPPSLSAGLLGLAFVGGLILNLMPCVFPVLGLKIMSFVNQAGEERGKVVAHGLVYTLGVLVSFWVLSGVLLALRAGGEQLGWGFQLQSPGFVLALAVLLLVFALNLSGVFEVGHSAVGVGSKLTGKSGLSGSFFSGVLATVVATPCAAPFLAPALGGALSLPPVGSVTVFTAVGLGLAAPYLLLSVFPHWASRLPRPGAWMETFKQLMAFLLYATVAALVWVLAGQVESHTLLVILFALVLAALGAWVLGRWAQPHLAKGKRVTAWVVALVLILGPALYAWSQAKEEQRRREEIAAAQAGEGGELDFLVWEKWSPETVEKLLAEGRPVYIDFTARWCATCQVNKRVYDNTSLIKDFQSKNVATLKADWTNHDPAITRALAAFDRGAVPFNVLYIPGRETPVILPELLTVSNVAVALAEIP